MGRGFKQAFCMQLSEELTDEHQLPVYVIAIGMLIIRFNTKQTLRKTLAITTAY